MWISQCEAPGRGPGLQRSSPLVRPVGRAPDVALRRAQGLATHTLTHPHTHVRLLAFLCLLLVVGCRPAPPPTLPAVNTDRYLIGAHYHVWYPSNFTHGYLRNALDPPQQPLLGHYRSSDPAVAEQHIAWCSRYGIDFLTLDWWPNRPEQNAAIQAGVMRAANLADIAFCIFYEAWDLNFDPATGATRFTDEVAARFVKHMHDLADTFFDHPAYLRVAGRPVVMLYLARTFAGDYARAVRQARRELAARGVEPFFIADEVFWGVIADRPSLRRNVMPAVGPQMRRIACFDAIFGYNLYDWSRPTHAGYGAESDFMRDAAALYATFRDAAQHTAYFVPDLLPGYNDRGVRPGEDHFAIPRQWDAAAPGSFFAEGFDRLGFPFMDPRLNMCLVTSWNEWNEDTGIEPLAEATGTRRNSGETGYELTEGYVYAGYGLRHLEILRDKVVAVCGRTVDAAGNPAGGVPVTAQQDGATATVRSDSRGYYRVSRLRMKPGRCRVSVPGTASATTVTIDAAGTITGVNLRAP